MSEYKKAKKSIYIKAQHPDGRMTGMTRMIGRYEVHCGGQLAQFRLNHPPPNCPGPHPHSCPQLSSLKTT